jgi:hypothetical protein
VVSQGYNRSSAVASDLGVVPLDSLEDGDLCRFIRGGPEVGVETLGFIEKVVHNSLLILGSHIRGVVLANYQILW